MINYVKLLKNDWNIIGRDPMLIVSMFAPFLLLAFAVFGFPLISDLTIRFFDFPINEYFSIGYLFFLPIIPMLLGMVYGFMLLDERDGGIISYLSITPFGKSGYLTIRMLIPVLFSFVLSFLFFISTGLFHDQSFVFRLFVALIISFEAPIMLLFLAAFADNKVEGLAISKGFGIFLIAIPLDVFLSGNWRWLLSFSPLWWIERATFQTDFQWVYLIGAAIIHALFIYMLYRKFTRKFD